MPIKRGKDSDGCYYQWGNQKKYHYKCGDPRSRARARKKAEDQAAAIKSRGGHRANSKNRVKRWRRRDKRN